MRLGLIPRGSAIIGKGDRLSGDWLIFFPAAGYRTARWYDCDLMVMSMPSETGDVETW